MYELNGRRYLTVRSTVALGVALLTVGFGTGFLVSVEAAGSEAISNSGEPTSVDFSPVWKAWNILNENFVPDAVASSTPIATSTAGLDQEKVWGMISGLADSLHEGEIAFR